MLDKQLREGRLWARLRQYKNLLRRSLDAIEQMEQIAPRSYVSISFGKQSLVVAHMLYQIKPDIPMLFLASGETWLMHNYADVIDQFTARWPINLSITQTDHVFDGSDKDWQSSRDAGQNDLQKMGTDGDWDGWYWGLAKEESKQRRLTLSRRKGQPKELHRYIFKYKSGKYRCCPLSDWGVKDLAAYIATYDIPLLDIYHKEGLQARTTARLTRKAAEWGGLTALKHTDMTAFNKLCQRFPELRGVQTHQ